MSCAGEPAAQAGLKLAAVQDNVASLAAELQSSVANFRQRLGQRARGDMALGSARVVNAARKRVSDAVKRASEFGECPEFAGLPPDTMRSLASAASVAVGVLANNPAVTP